MPLFGLLLLTEPLPITSTVIVVVASERPPALATPSASDASSTKHRLRPSVLPIRRQLTLYKSDLLWEEGVPGQRLRSAVGVGRRQPQDVGTGREEERPRADKAGPGGEAVILRERLPAVDTERGAGGVRRVEVDGDRPGRP